MKWTFLVPPVLYGHQEVERVFGCNYGLYPIPNIFMLYNASAIREAGYKVSFIDAPILKWGKDDFIKYLQGDRSDVYLFYSVNLAKETDLMAAEMIRSYSPSAWVVFMGPGPTHVPDEYLKINKSIVIRGEMENTASSLADVLSPGTGESGKALKSCRGISYRLEGRVEHNPTRDTIPDIDRLPFPARDLLDKDKYFNPKIGITPYTVLLTSRGCAFRCRYCVPNSLSFARELEFRRESGDYRKPKVAVRSFENVYEEMLRLKKEGYKAVSILDDQFIWSGKREIKIAEAMGEMGFSWGCLSRAEIITEDIARAFGDNNCKYVDIGVESFCQNILDDIRKDTTAGKLYNGIKLLKKFNVPVKLNILFGASPLETMETINQTYSVVKELDPDSIMVGICNPFPGTEFWEIAQRENWLLHHEYQPVDVQKVSTIAYPHLSKEQLEKAVRRANLTFFLRPEFILKNLKRIKNPADFIKSGKSLLKKITGS